MATGNQSPELVVREKQVFDFAHQQFIHAFRPLTASPKPLALCQMLNSETLRSPNSTHVGAASVLSYF